MFMPRPLATLNRRLPLDTGSRVFARWSPCLSEETSALSPRSCESGRYIEHHPLARPVAALEAGRLSLAANTADPGG
jgi:hypothetical protein